MESELWRSIVRAAEAVGKEFPFFRVQYSERVIALVAFWAEVHQQPICWACRTAPLVRRPSPSTMSRRMFRGATQKFLARMLGHLSPRRGPTWCKWMDSRPLPVGGSSHDPDAHVGRAAGLMAKGYKLHLISDGGGRVVAWDVRPMNDNDKTAAPPLLRRLDDEGYVVADNQYDSNPLFDLAGAHGHQLVVPRRKGTDFGHQKHSPYRFRSAALLESPFGQALLRQRYDIDRLFAQQGNFGAGLSPLPNWVRRLHRVRSWIHGKLVILAAWRQNKQRLTA